MPKKLKFTENDFKSFDDITLCSFFSDYHTNTASLTLLINAIFNPKAELEQHGHKAIYDLRKEIINKLPSNARLIALVLRPDYIAYIKHPNELEIMTIMQSNPNTIDYVNKKYITNNVIKFISLYYPKRLKYLELNDEQQMIAYTSNASSTNFIQHKCNKLKTLLNLTK